jgi:hypothetical protein
MSRVRRLAGREIPRAELIEMLNTGRDIECWCISCDKTWPLSRIERAEVEHYLNNSTA